MEALLVAEFRSVFFIMLLCLALTISALINVIRNNFFWNKRITWILVLLIIFLFLGQVSILQTEIAVE